MSDVRTLLAYNIKRFRKMTGQSQMALAESVGCSTTLIGNIEIKKRFPSPENLNRIAAALNVQPADLFTETTRTEKKKIKSRENLKAALEMKLKKALNETFSETFVETGKKPESGKKNKKPSFYEGPRYCYGVEVPGMMEHKEIVDSFCEALKPKFRKKVMAWYKDHGLNWDAFEDLVEDEGFHLIPCRPGGTENRKTVVAGPCPPYVIGDYIFSARNNTKSVLKKRNPRFYHSLRSRLANIFAALKDSDVKTYEIFFDEDFEPIYDSNDPNFMTADDYF